MTTQPQPKKIVPSKPQPQEVPPLEKWTIEDWRRSAFPFCPQCMKDPTDVRFVAPGRGWGQNGQEPCPHGHILTPERMELGISWGVTSQILGNAICLVLGFISSFAFRPILVFVFACLIWSFVKLFRTRAALRVDLEILRRAAACPLHIPGIWVENLRDNQPWIERII